MLSWRFAKPGRFPQHCYVLRGPLHHLVSGARFVRGPNGIWIWVLMSRLLIHVWWCLRVLSTDPLVCDGVKVTILLSICEVDVLPIRSLLSSLARCFAKHGHVSKLLDSSRFLLTLGRKWILMHVLSIFAK